MPPASGPLTYAEKKAIWQAYRDLRAAIESQDETAVRERYSVFAKLYRGDFMSIVGAFDNGQSRKQWLGNMAHALERDCGPNMPLDDD